MNEEPLSETISDDFARWLQTDWPNGEPEAVMRLREICEEFTHQFNFGTLFRDIASRDTTWNSVLKNVEWARKSLDSFIEKLPLQTQFKYDFSGIDEDEKERKIDGLSKIFGGRANLAFDRHLTSNEEKEYILPIATAWIEYDLLFAKMRNSYIWEDSSKKKLNPPKSPPSPQSDLQ